MNQEDRDRIERQAEMLGLSERSIRLDCLRLAVQAMAAQPDRVPETAQAYVNFVLGLSAVLPVLPAVHQKNRNKS
jgi:hypothetical protein